MLRKLLKYDFRANLKIFVFVWPAILLLALITRFILQADMDGTLYNILSGSTVSIFVIVLIAANIFAFIISVIRFYAGLLGKEGYLMFTLPVKPWQLVASKFIVALTLTVVTLGLSILAAFYQFLGVEGYKEAIKLILTAMDFPTGTTLTLTLCIFAASLCMQILQFYYAACMGHLFRRKRILWSVLIWYATDTLIRISMLIGIIILTETSLLELESIQATNSMLGVILALQCIMSAAYFFICERILSKRLNLE